MKNEGLAPRRIWPETRVRFADADESRDKTADGYGFAPDVFLEPTECLMFACPFPSSTCDPCRLNPDQPMTIKKSVLVQTEHRVVPRPKLTLMESEFYAMEMVAPTVRGSKLKHMCV